VVVIAFETYRFPWTCRVAAGVAVPMPTCPVGPNTEAVLMVVVLSDVVAMTFVAVMAFEALDVSLDLKGRPEVRGGPDAYEPGSYQKGPSC